MNNKTYANYLMHGRTKGSRNGISTTKGYTAVGQKAKGKLINGKYVYDTPVAYGNNTEMIRDGKVIYENPSVPTGVASYPKKKSDWAKEAASYDNHVTTYPKQGYDALMMEKRNAWLAEKAKAQGASNNWQQQAALEQWKKQNQNAIAANKKAQALKDVAAKGSQNNWQNQGARHRAAMETVRNNGAGFYEVTSDVNAYYDRKSQKAREEKAAKLPNAGASQAGNTARAMKEYMTKASADRKAKTQAAIQAAKQPTNIGASQSADLARWSQQNRNNIAASKKAAAKQELIKKADASYAANQGKANNWQQQAAKTAARGNTNNRVKSGASQASSFTDKVNRYDMLGGKRSALVHDPRFTEQAKPNVRIKTAEEMHEAAMRETASTKGAANNWQEMGNQRRAANEAFVKAGTGKTKTADIRGMDRKAREEATVRYLNDVVSTNAKYRKQQSDLYGAGDTKTRNARSDVRNAYEDAKLEAKNAFLTAKEKAGAKLYTKLSYLNNKYEKKKKKK